jgi:xanthine dehydrogenase small subunit
MSDVIRFYVDDVLVEVGEMPASTTLLDYLRLQCGKTGVKEGCAEGDCGACTVALGEAGSDGMRWQAVNSCLRFLPTVDGRHVLTAQGLSARGAPLHPVQQAMVDCHASQCGFCTPGFVMSLFVHYLQAGSRPLTREALVVSLTGNLCRCTGYRPIIDAGLSMGRYPEPVRWSAADAHSPARLAQLAAIRRTRSFKRPDFHAPRSLDELAAAYLAAPDSLILAGGTDVGLWVTKQLRVLPPMIHVGEVSELQRVVRHAGEIEIGAAVSLEMAFAALLADYPHLQELAERFASTPVRNAGTLCGNVANGSPIGDSMPALIALGARARLRCGERVRELPLEDFYLGYQKKDLQRGEFVAALCVPTPTVPTPAAQTHHALYKIAKRRDQDISALCAGLAVTVSDGRVSRTRIAFGGMAATPTRARGAEAALCGARWDAAAIEQAIAALAADFAPLTDLRASQGYRRVVAGNLLRRFWQETQAVCPLRIEALQAVQP